MASEGHVVSLDGMPIGPTWQAEYFLGADENGRDLMVRLLYGARTSLLIGAGALALTLLSRCRWRSPPATFEVASTRSFSRLLDLIWSFPALLLGRAARHRAHPAAARRSARCRSRPGRS